MSGDTIWFRFRVDCAIAGNNTRELAARLRRVSPLAYHIGRAGLFAPLLYSLIIVLATSNGLQAAWTWIDTIDVILARWHALVPAVAQIRASFPAEHHGDAGVVLSHIVGVCQLLFAVLILAYALLLLASRSALRWQLPGTRPAKGVTFLVVSGVLSALVLYLSIVVLWFGYHLSHTGLAGTIITIWVVHFAGMIIGLAAYVVMALSVSALLTSVFVPLEKAAPSAGRD